MRRFISLQIDGRIGIGRKSAGPHPEGDVGRIKETEYG
jgi:hypothetical protein